MPTLWSLAAIPNSVKHPVKSYLLTIARNLYLEQWRREKRKSSLDYDVGFAGKQYEDAASRQEVERVMEAMRQLPELERAALLLRAGDSGSVGADESF